MYESLTEIIGVGWKDWWQLWITCREGLAEMKTSYRTREGSGQFSFEFFLVYKNLPGSTTCVSTERKAYWLA